MKVVRSRERDRSGFDSARRAGQSYFAEPFVYIERYLEILGHIDVHVLDDAHGNVIASRSSTARSRAVNQKRV